MAFDNQFDGWWWSFIGAFAGILAFRSLVWFTKMINTWSDNRQEQRQAEQRRLERDASYYAEELGDDLDEQLDAMHEEDSFTIKLAPCMPEHDPDSENCDVWVNTTDGTPHVYVRHEEDGEEPLWNSMRTSTDGGIILINGDLMVSLVVVESKVLVHTIKDLMKCTHRSELELETIRHLDSVGESKAHALCIASGFDPEKLMPTPRDEANTGKRVIDLGK